MSSVFHTMWYCRRVEQKTVPLKAQSVGRLVNVGTSSNYETGQVNVTYLDPSTKNPVAGHGIHYGVTLDGAELIEFVVRRASAESPRLTRRLIHGAPVEAIADRAKAEVRSAQFAAMNQWMLDTFEGVPLMRQDGTVAPFSMPGVRKLAQTAWGDFKRPGRAGRNEIEYAVLAAEYVELVNEGHGRNVNKILGERHHLSASQVTNLIRRATELDLKDKPPIPGRAGGELTQKAMDLLSEGAA